MKSRLCWIVGVDADTWKLRAARCTRQEAKRDEVEIFETYEAADSAAKYQQSIRDHHEQERIERALIYNEPGDYML
ncbi:hypothetical protein [Spirosoma profusum]|nr:hypothetical protein [Spirosoma profusum]